MKSSGVPEGPMERPKFSSEEADLMSTVFQSALRLFSGSATRNELAGELSDKLYSGRAGAGDMSELGIELVKPGGGSLPPEAGGNTNAHAQPGVPLPPGARLPAKQRAEAARADQARGTGTRAGAPASAEDPTDKTRDALLTRYWKQAKVYSVEMMMIPVVLLGMVLVSRVQRRRSHMDDMIPAGLGIQTPAESEPYDMKYAVHGMKAEDFELLVALIYQRQGYRISMPAGLSGGRGGDFTLLRKSERVLVQCKKMSQDHRIPVERVRELHESMLAINATRGLYVTSCGFTWDARNFAKTKNITLINARTLDALLTVARERPEENLLDVSGWVTKLMSKVELTPPLCPACEAKMDQITASNGAVWVCSQRPECRGRRSARQTQQPAPSSAARKVSV